MGNGYKIVWTDFALGELSKTIEYLEENFTDKEIQKLANEIEKTVILISNNPTIFSESETKKVRKVVILRYNTLYYRTVNKNVEILSFFSNRQNPDRRKIS